MQWYSITIEAALPVAVNQSSIVTGKHWSTGSPVLRINRQVCNRKKENLHDPRLRALVSLAGQGSMSAVNRDGSIY